MRRVSVCAVGILIVVLLTEGFVTSILGIDIGWLKYVLAVTAVGSSLWARRAEPLDVAELRLISSLWFLGIIAVAAAILNNSPTSPLLKGLVIPVAWASLFLVGGAPGVREDRHGLNGLIIAVAGLSAVFAAIQHLLGVDQLLSLGYDYFTNVREVNGHVRAFGFTAYGIPFGHSMGVIAVYFLVQGGVDGRRRRWGVGLGVVGVLLSLNRTAIAGLILACVVAALQRRGTRSQMIGGVALALVSSIAIAAWWPTLVVDGVSRAEVWGETLSVSSLAVGQGPGAVGVASLEGVDQRIESLAGGELPTGVVDSGYVSLVAQVGLLAVPAMAILVTAPLAGRGRSRMRLLPMVIYWAWVLTFVDAWPDVPTAPLFWLLTGMALSVPRPAAVRSRATAHVNQIAAGAG